MYADSEGVGEALAGVLSGVTVTVAESLASALECDSEVLVLELEERREGRLNSATVTRLQGRKMVVTGTGANWLCRELDLDIGGWMVGSAQSLRTCGSWGGTEWAKVSFEAFARPQAEGASGVSGRDPRHISWQRVPEELRLEDEHGFIETLVHLDRDVAYGLMMRQANCIFAGVMAHPDEWSHVYRNLFSQAVGWLAARQTEEFRVAVVPRPQHPPGTVRFTLDPLDGAEVGAHRRFFFRFDRPTVFTGVLRHSGSTAVELAFVGGRRALHATRTATEHGEPLSVTVTVGESAIKQMADRYWTLDVLNFDIGNGMSAELTVRYDAVDGGSIQPMPSDASFERFHWFAERMAVGDGPTRRQATADAFGLDDWRTLQGHVAWSAAKPPEDGAPMREIYFARAKARYGESFGLEELLEFHVAQIETSAGLRRALEDAFATAAEQGHEAAGVEHLLLALLDDAVAKDVLVKCGADADELRHGLVDSFESANPVGAPGVSPELFGVLVRTSLYRALGRKGSNTANILAGVFAEACRARDLLQEQGLSRDDVMRYLVFGIPKSLSDPQPTKGMLAPQVERALYDAYRDAETKRHEAFGVDHLLLALVGQPSLVGQLASEVDLRCMGSELAEFVATTPVGDGQPRPTRRWTQRCKEQQQASERRAITP